MRQVSFLGGALYDGHYAMLQRNLLYTSLTRGKRLVVLVGQMKAVAIAVRNVSKRKGWSKFREWLI
jgi:exodeoxyribonuclease V alpha subunit